MLNCSRVGARTSRAGFSRSIVWAAFALTVACGSDKTAGEPTSESGSRDAGQADTGSGSRDARVGTAKDASSARPDAKVGSDPADDPKSGLDPNPVSLDDCKAGAAGLSPTDLAALQHASDPAAARITYPYDGTVFPRGIEGPLVAWDGVDASDAVYLHIKSSAFEYRGCLKPTGDRELQLPQDVWDSASAKTLGKSEPYQVELSVINGGKVAGPVKQKWVIAAATIKGSVYYNSYLSLSGGAGIGGTIYRIPPKGKAEAFLAVECNGCHSVSGNGARMTVQTLALGARTYGIETGTPEALTAPLNNAYSAMYPDGSRYLVGSQVIDVGRANIATPALQTPPKAALYDTDTGATLTMNGVPPDVLMPSISPTGKLLVYNDYAIGEAHGLGISDYDVATNTATNYRAVAHTDGAMRPGWPFALPDDRAVIYVQTESTDFSAYGAGVGTSLTSVVAPYSELFVVDLASGKSTILARAMGYDDPSKAKASQTNLPFGEEELKKSYFPTVSPVAAGGYFWIFFDSLRHWGNRGLSRQLWGTAVEISADGDYTVDRSAPAFYLPGQNFGTGNHRAFTALDACKDDGAGCESGVDCCGGSCTVVDEFGQGKCGPVTMCAKTDERCASDSDCCKPGVAAPKNSCIANFCSPILL